MDVKNCYIWSNLVKEIYLGDKLVKINDHVKFKIQQPEYNSYISQTPISSEETYINIDVRLNYSKAYSYIYQEGLITETEFNDLYHKFTERYSKVNQSTNIGNEEIILTEIMINFRLLFIYINDFFFF